MEKRGWLKWSLVIPAVILTIGLTSCPGDMDLTYAQDLPPIIGPEGGVVDGFDGEVVLTIPAGSLNERIRFSMHELLYKSALSECELLKTFVIEPSVNFNLPVKLTVQLNGCLANGAIPGEGMEVFFYTWDDVSSYALQTGECCLTCCVDMTSGSISSCISRTGVVATVGIRK